MYRLSRLLLALTLILLLVACFAAAVSSGTGYVIATITFFLVVSLRHIRSGFTSLTTLGSARWATLTELRKAGMLNGGGVILGRMTVRRRLIPALMGLLNPKLSSQEACMALLKKKQAVTVSTPNVVHHAIYASTGAGKNVSIVTPLLMTCRDSCVVVDFKGESYALTAEHRREVFGHRIVALDPFGVGTKKSDSFNPLDFIDKDDPNALDQCMALAKSLVVRTGEEKEPHWNDSAEAVIGAVIAVTVFYADKELRSLQAVKDIISDAARFELAIKCMAESDAWGGMLARKGNGLKFYVEKEKSSVMTTVGRHLAFLDTPAVAECTRSSSFATSLRRDNVTVYLILPPEHMRSQAPLLRMWIHGLMRGVVSGGLQEKKLVRFILDEAAALEKFDDIEDALERFRGYGVRLELLYQSTAQLQKCFPRGADQTVRSNTSETFFAVNDTATAEAVSTKLGEFTAIVQSGGRNKSTSTQTSHSPHPNSSRSVSVSSSSNWNQQARKLLLPAELMNLDQREAISFVSGVRPIRTRLLRAYEEKGIGLPVPWYRRAGAALGTLIVSAVLCLLALGIAAIVAAEVGESHQPPPPVYQVKW